MGSFSRVNLPSSPSRPPAWAGRMRSSTTDTGSSPARTEGRHGTNFTDRLPKIAEAVCSLAAESALIDGEAVALRPDGHSDFATLRTKAGSARACLVAFDLLTLNGEDFRQRPLEERRLHAGHAAQLQRRRWAVSVCRSDRRRRRGPIRHDSIRRGARPWDGVRARQPWRRRLHAGHAAQLQRHERPMRPILHVSPAAER